jgi:hypothetical protein
VAMAKISKIIPFLIFSYLILFPLGQIISFRFKLAGFTIPFHPTDFIIFALGLSYILNYKNKLSSPAIKMVEFLGVLAFSLVFSLTIFPSSKILIGTLYLIRLIFYFIFGLSITVYAASQNKKNLLINSLLVVAFFLGLFGLMQYVSWPDLRPFFEYGWDDHLYRLVGTFLDPTFTGLFLVFGSILSLSFWYKLKKKNYLFLFFFLTLSLILTYARACYLAYAASIGYLMIKNKDLKLILLAIISFVLILFAIPFKEGEGVNLARTRSIFFRAENYQEALILIKKSPVFGLGYNNLCIAKEKYLNKVDLGSHSCSGFDASLLLLLSTGGIVGLTIFSFLVFDFYKNLSGFWGNIIKLSFVALLIHSLFVNSLFYPWVLGWFFILLGISGVLINKGNN